MKMMDDVIRWSIRNRLVVVLASLGVVALRRGHRAAHAGRRVPRPHRADGDRPHRGARPRAAGGRDARHVPDRVRGERRDRRAARALRLGRSASRSSGSSSTGAPTSTSRARSSTRSSSSSPRRAAARHRRAPTLAPISSIMGEILFIAHPQRPPHAAGGARGRRLDRAHAACSPIPGVAQVVPIGGGVRQFQVQVDPAAAARLRRHARARSPRRCGRRTRTRPAASSCAARQESLIRGVGRITARRRRRASGRGRPRRRAGPRRPGRARSRSARRSSAARARRTPSRPSSSASRSSRARTRSSSPRGSTASSTRSRRRCPKGMMIERDKVAPGRLHRDRRRQRLDRRCATARSSSRSSCSCSCSNVRTTLISLARAARSRSSSRCSRCDAIGVTINTMTLGGLTIAIGALVDDAIIDVENVFRRLRENARACPRPSGAPPDDVIYEASREVRGSIVFATLIVMLVFVPLFFLTGVEGRLLRTARLRLPRRDRRVAGRRADADAGAVRVPACRAAKRARARRRLPRALAQARLPAARCASRSAARSTVIVGVGRAARGGAGDGRRSSAARSCPSSTRAR